MERAEQDKKRVEMKKQKRIPGPGDRPQAFYPRKASLLVPTDVLLLHQVGICC